MSNEIGSDFFGSFTMTVSLELGYSFSESFTETYEESSTERIAAEAHASTAMYTKQSQYYLFDANDKCIKKWSRCEGALYYSSLPIDNGESAKSFRYDEEKSEWIPI